MFQAFNPALITRRPTEPLNASERVKQIVEKFGINDVEFRLNHAHALLFNGRDGEALNEYRELDPVEVKVDVQTLVEIGLCHPIFNELAGPAGRCVASDK
jgi:hypothetical protein